MKKAYMVCDWHDGKAAGEAWNIGVEYMGNCRGRILDETGVELGHHHSSTFGWLRVDLSRKVNEAEYEIVDLIEHGPGAFERLVLGEEPE